MIGTFGCSVFAPLADIDAQSGGTNGSIVGNNITQRYEVRRPFSGDLPEPPGVVPLRAAAWLLIGGLGGLVAAGRRRAA